MSTRYQHIKFHKLKIGEDFFFRRFRYTKTAYFVGRTVLDGRAVVVMPWTKVRSTRPYGPLVNKIVGHIAKRMAVNSPYLGPLVNKIVGHIAKRMAVNSPYLDVINAARPPQTVTPGGDRRSETIGGKELTPSA